MTEAKRKEKINELMNKISLSLKDANLQQGFEIICKRIAELEKENESLKNTLREIARDTNEHETHNVAQNELDKWEFAEK